MSNERTLEEQCYGVCWAAKERIAELEAELCRLHSVNAELLEALWFCAGTSYIDDAHRVAQQAIARAEEVKP